MSNEGTSNSRFLLRYADREIGRYLVVVPHTNVPDIHSLPPNCASSIEWHSRLSFNIQVLGKMTYFPQESKQINQCRGLVTDISWIQNVWTNENNVLLLSQDNKTNCNFLIFLRSYFSSPFIFLVCSIVKLSC